MSVLLRRLIVRVPVLTLSVVPPARVMTALPLSRSASTTPLATVSLAVRVRFPLSVVMFALISRLRPAWRVRLPPLPPGL